MAKECGWNKDYISDNLTVQQIMKYCEIIQKQKIREVQLDGIVDMYSMATAFGSVKYKDFISFLKGLAKEDINMDDTLREMKKQGLPIEEN